MWQFDFLLIVNLVVLLYIWFDTDAFIEWASLFRCKWFKYQEFNEIKKNALSAVAGKSYCEFLLFKYGRYFLIRLITCPICFTVWVNIVLYFLFSEKISVYLLGPNIMLSWILYHSLRHILQKLNA